MTGGGDSLDHTAQFLLADAAVHDLVVVACRLAGGGRHIFLHGRAGLVPESGDFL